MVIIKIIFFLVSKFIVGDENDEKTLGTNLKCTDKL